MPHVIAEPCVGRKDGACAAICPTKAIGPVRGSPDFKETSQLYVDPGACIDCGLCVDECPTKAIFPIDDLPPQWKHYADINARHFQLKAADAR